VGGLRAAARAAGRLAFAGAAGGLAVWYGLYRALEPGPHTVVEAVLAILLLIPAGILVLFIVAVRTLIALPERLTRVPGAVLERTGEVRRRAAELSEARRRGAWASLVAGFRFLWAVVTSREVLEVLSPATVLLTPWMLVASILAAGAVVFEVLAGIVALLVLALA
jgi:hypothetical protein